MLGLATLCTDKWLARRAEPDPRALAAVAGRAPATVVTGASRGIGLALAERFAEAGHTVLLVARTPAALAAAAEQIAKVTPARVETLVLDICDSDAPSRINRHLAGHGLYLDILVNNAGIGLAGAFEEAKLEDLERLIALNIGALTRLTHAVIPDMRRRARGGVLNMASVGGVVPGPYQAAYYASKSFVVSLTEAIAEELAGRGVRIAVVLPGPVTTPFHTEMGADTALYRRIVPHMPARKVARAAYRGFMLGRRVIVPGLLWPLIAYAARIMPRPIMRPIIARLLATTPSAGPRD